MGDQRSRHGDDPHPQESEEGEVRTQGSISAYSIGVLGQGGERRLLKKMTGVPLSVLRRRVLSLGRVGQVSNVGRRYQLVPVILPAAR